MAVTAANAVNFESSTNAATYTTGSWTPVANRLYILAVASSGTFRTVSSFTDGTGLNWVSIATTGAFNTSYNISLYRAMKASGLGAGTTQANLSGSASRGSIVITEFQGMDTSGTDGSGAVVQSKTGILASAGTSLSISLNSAPTGGNSTFGAMSTNLSVDTGITAGTGNGYTEITERHVQTIASEAQDVETEFAGTANQTVNWTFTSSTAGGVGVEVLVAAAAPDYFPPYPFELFQTRVTTQ